MTFHDEDLFSGAVECWSFKTCLVPTTDVPSLINEIKLHENSIPSAQYYALSYKLYRYG